MNRRNLVFALLSMCCATLAPAQKSKRPEPNAIVRNLYAAEKAKRSPFFQSEDRARVDQYFTKTLGNLIWKDAVESKGEVGKLDFDPLYGSQDPQIKDFVIGENGWGGDKKSGPETEAVVQVTFKDSGKEKMISFRFLQGKDQQWKIDDIRYPDLDDLLLKDLLSPLKSKNQGCFRAEFHQMASGRKSATAPVMQAICHLLG